MHEDLTVGRLVAEAAERFELKPAIIGPSGTLSFRDLECEANRAARAWLRRGVKRGDRVALWMENSPNFVIAWMGLAKVGASLVAVHTRFNDAEATQVIAHSTPRLLVTDHEHFSTANALVHGIPSLEEVLIDSPSETGSSRSAIWESEITEPVDVDVAQGDIVSIIYTSGTTGVPKGVMQSHRTYVLTGQAYPWWLGLTEEDCLYVCLPLSHINAQAYSIMASLVTGCTLALVPRFSVSRFWSDIHTYGATAANLIGSMLVLISRLEEKDEDADNPLRLIYSGAVGRLPVAERAALESRYQLRLLTGMGMSETTFGFIQPLDSAPRVGSVGKPRGHFDPAVSPSEVRVVDADEHDVKTGEVGEILLRNAAMFSGYQGDPDLTARSVVDGWFHTGDLAYFDEEGFYFFADRKKDLIRRRGENVSSVEVERALEAHPAVSEAAVIGVPSELLDEDIFAFVSVVPGSQITAAELWEWLDQRLAPFKVPEYLSFVADFPRTRTEKISKEELRPLARTADAHRRPRQTKGTETKPDLHTISNSRA